MFCCTQGVHLENILELRVGVFPTSSLAKTDTYTQGQNNSSGSVPKPNSSEGQLFPHKTTNLDHFYTVSSGHNLMYNMFSQHVEGALVVEQIRARLKGKIQARVSVNKRGVSSRLHTYQNKSQEQLVSHHINGILPSLWSQSSKCPADPKLSPKIYSFLFRSLPRRRRLSKAGIIRWCLCQLVLTEAAVSTEEGAHVREHLCKARLRASGSQPSYCCKPLMHSLVLW